MWTNVITAVYVETVEHVLIHLAVTSVCAPSLSQITTVTQVSKCYIYRIVCLST